MVANLESYDEDVAISYDAALAKELTMEQNREPRDRPEHQPRSQGHAAIDEHLIIKVNLNDITGN